MVKGRPTPAERRDPIAGRDRFSHQQGIDRAMRSAMMPSRPVPQWRNGRRGRLKICCRQRRAGSSPAWGTNGLAHFVAGDDFERVRDDATSAPLLGRSSAMQARRQVIHLDEHGSAGSTTLLNSG